MKKLFFTAAAACAVVYSAYAQDILSPVDSSSVSVQTADAVLSDVKAATDSAGVAVPVTADGLDADGSLLKYRRSSLYSVLISHPGVQYGDEIQTAFFSIPMPDKFNDHNIECRNIASSSKKMKKQGKQKDALNQSDIKAFLETNGIPRTLVAKWFNRNASTGGFDMSLIQERGFYDASQADIQAASKSSRNLAMLGDAGEDLIGKTFMLVNDITYVDKGKNSATAAAVLQGLGNLAGALFGSSFSDLGKTVAVAVNEIDGFTVNVTSYLYKLNWDEYTSNTFYQDYWFEADSTDLVRRNAFDVSPLFSMSYVGSTMVSASNTSSKSFSKRTKEEQMLMTCARAVDRAIVKLQREYDEFKVNVPITTVNDDRTVEVPRGVKEGVTLKSRYEVLQARRDENGRVTYQRIGMLAPVEGYIWDNRFGALDDARAEAAASAAEKAEKQKAAKQNNDPDDEGEGNALLTSTRFKIVEGNVNRIMPGSLVRECRIK